MKMSETADKISKEKRTYITNAVEKNRDYMRNYPKYHAESLNLMFAEWHILFPQHRQDLNCSSCRGAVCKFWEMMVDEWNKNKETTKKKTNVKKTKKQKAK